MGKIMVQGCSSSAGKSVLAMALARIFSDMGYRVAPFKSQNMSRIFHRLENGLIMSNAQVIQAFAARVSPDVRMNPVLLIPKTENGSDVIVEGKLVKSMKAKDYFEYKKDLKLKIQDIYNDLEDEFDIVVLEGAGSPAEINLREGDIVNMGMAEMADSDVILVVDIDRGGAFASLYGTVMILPEEERKRFKGLVINKFRGDVDLLKPGLKMIEDLTGVPVLGVIPFSHLEVPDEDSLIDYEKDANKGDKDFIKLNSEIDRFARLVRDNLDIEKVAEIAGVEYVHLD